MVTEGRSAGGGEVARTGVLAKLPHSPSGALQLDMDGSEYQPVHSSEFSLVNNLVLI